MLVFRDDFRSFQPRSQVFSSQPGATLQQRTSMTPLLTSQRSTPSIGGGSVVTSQPGQRYVVYSQNNRALSPQSAVFGTPQQTGPTIMRVTTPQSNNRLVLLPSSGGTPAQLTTPDANARNVFGFPPQR